MARTIDARNLVRGSRAGTRPYGAKASSCHPSSSSVSSPGTEAVFLAAHGAHDAHLVCLAAAAPPTERHAEAQLADGVAHAAEAAIGVAGEVRAPAGRGRVVEGRGGARLADAGEVGEATGGGVGAVVGEVGALGRHGGAGGVDGGGGTEAAGAEAGEARGQSRGAGGADAAGVAVGAGERPGVLGAEGG